MLMLKVMGVMVIAVVVVDDVMVELEDVAVGAQVHVEEADVQIDALVIVTGKGDLEVVGEEKVRIVSY